MTTNNQSRKFAPKDMKVLDDAAIDAALEGMRGFNPDPDLLRNLASIVGRAAPLQRPSAADAHNRRFVAKRLSESIASQIDEGELLPCAGFELFSPAWVQPAHRAALPVGTITEMAIKPLKKRFSDVAWMISASLERTPNGDQQVPSLKAFVMGKDVDETVYPWLGDCGVAWIPRVNVRSLGSQRKLRPRPSFPDIWFDCSPSESSTKPVSSILASAWSSRNFARYIERCFSP